MFKKNSFSASVSSSTSATRITFKYVLVATLWIFFTDYVLRLMGLNDSAQQWLQTAKGVAFVVVTGAVLFFSARFH